MLCEEVVPGAAVSFTLTTLEGTVGPSESYSYNVLGRMSSETRTINPGGSLGAVQKSVSYTYNLNGSLSTVTYPSGAVISYAVDAAGREISAIDNGNQINYLTGATYEADNGITGFVNGASGGFAGITNSFSYNKRLQPLNVSAVSPTQTVFNISYDFHVGAGDNGNIFAVTNNKDTTRSQSFTYDALNRVTSAQTSGTDCSAMTANSKNEYWGNNYGYDAWGNLLSKTVTQCGAENLSVTASPNNQFQTGGYTYDIAGNMLHDATANLNYSYDAENRIGGANGYTYTYDDDGDRVEKSNGSSGTLYWYMAPGVVAESDLTGNLTAEYVFFAGRRIARKDMPSAVSYYFSDQLKTASVIADSNGNIKAESDFYPWGGELTLTANDSNHYKFTGKERDSETGLDYFGARYYSNGVGRFITPDWAAKAAAVPYADLADPQSLNLYSYVRNRPTVLVDPDGHEDEGGGDGGGGGMQSQFLHRGGGIFGSATTSGMEASALASFSGSPTEDNQADATQDQAQQSPQQGQTQNQPKQISADDVAKAAQAYNKDKDSKGPARIVQVLNSFGDNWILSGDALRDGVAAAKKNGVDVSGTADKVLKNVDSISRVGNSVTITNKKSIVVDGVAKLDKTIKFTIASVGGKAALQNLSGIHLGVTTGFAFITAKSPDHYGP